MSYKIGMSLNYPELFTYTKVLSTHLGSIEYKIRVLFETESAISIENMTDHQIINKTVYGDNRIEPLCLQLHERYRTDNGTKGIVEINIPFEGSVILFEHRPSITQTTIHPKAKICKSHISIVCKITDSDDENELEIESKINNIDSWLSLVNNDIRPHTINAEKRARALISKLRQEITDDIKRGNFFDSIGIPKK